MKFVFTHTRVTNRTESIVVGSLILFKVDRLQIILVAKKYISTCLSTYIEIGCRENKIFRKKKEDLK